MVIFIIVIIGLAISISGTQELTAIGVMEESEACISICCQKHELDMNAFPVRRAIIDPVTGRQEADLHILFSQLSKTSKKTSARIVQQVHQVITDVDIDITADDELKVRMMYAFVSLQDKE
jgi:hypothetical protein